MANTIILPSWLICSASEEPRRGWGVRVVDDRIEDVTTHDALRRQYPGDTVWDAEGQVLSPGFVNTHTHLYGALAHGIPLKKAPAGFWPFLKDFWWPMVEDQLDHELICAAADFQCALMIRSGVTAFYDCLEAPNAIPGGLDAEAGVVHKHGLRAVLSFEATERSSLENGQLGLQENIDFVAACRARGGLITGMICFHTTFTCSAPFIKQAFAVAGELDASVHMHCSEGSHEPAYALQHYGLRPLQYYDSLGVAGPRMLASQCVHLTSDEIGLMAKRGVRVSHMPLSNCEVGGGIAPAPELLEAGITLGLGSDSYVDDFFEVMRGAFLIHKANKQDPGVMPSRLVWYLATEGGAAALGLQHIGRIAPGWQADIQLIDAEFPTPAESWNLLDQLVLYRNSSHVRSVWVAGRQLLHNGVLLHADEKQLRQSLHQAATRLWTKAGGV